MATGCMHGWYDNNGFSGTNGAKAMETALGTRFAVIRHYHAPDDWPTVKLTQIEDRSDGGTRLVMTSHKPPKIANAWIAIARGDYDTQIDAMVDVYKAFGLEIIVIFHHEPHDNTEDLDTTKVPPTMGRAVDFVRAYRHFASRFKAKNAANVRLGYCAVGNKWAAKKATGSTVIGSGDPCWPGGDVVDVVCHDEYNFFRSLDPANWDTMKQSLENVVAAAKYRNKPLIIGEFGCQHGNGVFDRDQWFRDGAAWIKADPDASKYLLGMCYYHVDSHQDSGHYWRFVQGVYAPNGKQGYIDAFSSDPYFLTSPVPVSLQGAAAPPSDVGGSTPSGGTSTYVQPSSWENRLLTVDGVGITEVSGWASSPKGGAWAIRDSGNPASIYWMTQSSRGNFASREIAVTAGTNADWEDILYTVEGGTPYLYIHDNRDGNATGANPKRLYKVAEPATPGSASAVALISTRYWKFPDSASSSTCGTKQNCEAIFLFKGVLYAVQKTDATQAEVYRIGDPNTVSTTNSMAGATEGVKVGTIGMHCPSAFALHADGTTVITIQHGSVKVFRGTGDTIESLLTGKNTKISEWSPAGNWEGADWYPYQSNDMMITAENRDTYDVDASNGTAYGGGIPPSGGTGTPTVAPADGALAVTEVGAIPSPGDYMIEESAGLEFGLMMVTELGAIFAVGIASVAAVGNLEATRATGPGYLFTPPVRYNQPLVPAGTRGPMRLFRYMDGIPVSKNVYVLVDGSVTEAQPWDQDLIVNIYFGGHETPVGDTEADILRSAGYGVYLAPIVAATRTQGLWSGLADNHWGELAGYTWGELVLSPIPLFEEA